MNIEKRYIFNSIKVNYLIGFVLIVIFAIITGQFYGTGSTQLFPKGTWFVLGGFTLFLPTSGFQLLFGIWMLIRTFMTYQNIEVSQTGDEIKFLIQRLYRRKQLIELNRSEITSKFCQVKSSARQLWWIIPFGIHIAFLLTDGILLVSNPLNFGFGITNGWHYIITAFVDILVLAMILTPHSVNLRFETALHKYTLELNPLSQFSEKMPMLLALFDISPEKDSVSLKNFKIELLLGLSSILIAAITRLTNFAIGSPVRISLFLFGISIIIVCLQRGTLFISKPQEMNQGLGYGIGYEIIPVFGFISIVTVVLTIGTWFRFLLTASSFIGNSISLILITLFTLVATFFLDKSIFNLPLKKNISLIGIVFLISFVVSFFL